MSTKSAVFFSLPIYCQFSLSCLNCTGRFSLPCFMRIQNTAFDFFKLPPENFNSWAWMRSGCLDFLVLVQECHNHLDLLRTRRADCHGTRQQEAGSLLWWWPSLSWSSLFFFSSSSIDTTRTTRCTEDTISAVDGERSCVAVAEMCLAARPRGSRTMQMPSLRPEPWRDDWAPSDPAWWNRSPPLKWVQCCDRYRPERGGCRMESWEESWEASGHILQTEMLGMLSVREILRRYKGSQVSL